MGLLELLIVLVVIGFLLWIVSALIPMEPRVKSLVTGVGVFIAVVLVLYWLFGFLGVDTNVGAR